MVFGSGSVLHQPTVFSFICKCFEFVKIRKGGEIETRNFANILRIVKTPTKLISLQSLCDYNADD